MHVSEEVVFAQPVCEWLIKPVTISTVTVQAQ